MNHTILENEEAPLRTEYQYRDESTLKLETVLHSCGQDDGDDTTTAAPAGGESSELRAPELHSCNNILNVATVEIVNSQLFDAIDGV
jgi:hypothetical protein